MKRAIFYTPPKLQTWQSQALVAREFSYLMPPAHCAWLRAKFAAKILGIDGDTLAKLGAQGALSTYDRSLGNYALYMYGRTGLEHFLAASHETLPSDFQRAATAWINSVEVLGLLRSIKAAAGRERVRPVTVTDCLQPRFEWLPTTKAAAMIGRNDDFLNRLVQGGEIESRKKTLRRERLFSRRGLLLHLARKGDKTTQCKAAVAMVEATSCRKALAAIEEAAGQKISGVLDAVSRHRETSAGSSRRGCLPGQPGKAVKP